MNVLFLIGLITFTKYSVNCKSLNQTDGTSTSSPLPITKPSVPPTPELPVPPTPSENTVEDQQVINETITKYGFPKDFTILGLPGPELVADDNILSISNQLVTNESGTYTLKIRTITEHFSYNGRYEETKINKTGIQDIVVTKGQFGEHFERKSGGYYIRTIGYTLDENGYRQFLIDLSMAKTTTKEIAAAPEIPIVVVSGHPGGPSGNKHTISSTALGSLIGGNALG